MVQKTETKFRESVLACNINTYIDKIQVNIHAHTATTADFLIQTPNNDVMVECKETQIHNRFDISRLSQETRLVEYDNRHKRNKSYIFLTFWHINMKHSQAYLIPITDWISFRTTNTNKTLKDTDVYEHFKQFLCRYKDSTKSWNVELD